MSNEIGTAYNPQGMTQNALPDKQKKQKVWNCVADGIYRHHLTKMLYHRPGGRANRTWESLQTTNLSVAKERYAKLRYGAPPGGHATPDQPAEPAPVTMGQVIRKCAKDGYPDKHKAQRTGQTLDDEERHTETLLKFWDHLTVEACGPAACDRYHAWRKELGFQHGTGERQLDRELNTLNNACRWAVRSELIRYNPISERRRYQSKGSVHHCREFMPQNADELHQLAGRLFLHPHSVVLGFQLLAEAYSGLHTQEVLEWGNGQFGSTTQDGKFLHVWRCKGQHAVNPYVDVHEGLRGLLEAHRS